MMNEEGSLTLVVKRGILRAGLKLQPNDEQAGGKRMNDPRGHAAVEFVRH
jgi:hypothetical protein